MELIPSGMLAELDSMVLPMVLPMAVLLLLPALFYVKRQRSTTTSTSQKVQTSGRGAGRLRCVPVTNLHPEELIRLEDFLLQHWDTTAINYEHLVKLSTYVWIIEKNHAVLACAWAAAHDEGCWNKHSWILYSVCVHTDYRRRSLCRFVMEKIAEDAQQQRIWQLVLWVDVPITVPYADNKKWRIGMYHKFGFNIVSTHKENWGATFTVCMVKPLSAPTACAVAQH